MSMIPVANPDIGEEEERLVLEALRSGWISGRGPYVRRFEEELASWVGVRHAIATSSGTAALHLALMSLGIGPGDEVIVPDLTFASPASMVVLAGARPVFADVDPRHWVISADEVRRKITPRTKAIIVVHLYGVPANMGEIMEVAREENLYVIEDAAEALGATVRGRRVGSIGDVGVLSFYANKTVTTGEGGAVITNSDEVADMARLVRDHGMRPRYWHVVIGHNYRMTNLQAALGIAQLRKAEHLLKRKREIARAYAEALSGVEGIATHPNPPWGEGAFWLYSILIDKKAFGMSRDEVMQALAADGIETRRFFYPLHTMPAFSAYADNKYPVSEYLSARGLSLPSGPKIGDEEVLYVAERIRSLHKES